MATKRITPIVYSNIEEKNKLEANMFKALSPAESLTYTLDMMDFFAAMRKKRPAHPDDEKYPWIILKLKR